MHKFPQTESPASLLANEQASRHWDSTACAFSLIDLSSLFLGRKRSKQVTLVSTILSAPPVGEGLREKRAERECVIGLRTCAGKDSPWWEGRGRFSCSVRVEHVLANLLYQFLIRQAVEAVDGQV